jgi:hypothetical protein
LKFGSATEPCRRPNTLKTNDNLIRRRNEIPNPILGLQNTALAASASHMKYKTQTDT